MGDVISRSARILYARPLIMLPQLILLVPTVINDILNASLILSPLKLIISIVSLVLSVIASGAYPSMVKAVIAGDEPSVTDAFGKAYHRFWTLLLAGILVVLILIGGFIALIVPGIIFATWFAYTVPAVMLEGKGALEGMGASRAFGRDKKWSTFLIALTVAIVYLVISVVDSLFSLASPLLGQIVYAALLVPVGAWGSVIFSYAYLTYGPSPVTATTETPGLGLAPPASPQASVLANASSDRSAKFCRFCGSPVQADSKFCASCGKPL